MYTQRQYKRSASMARGINAVSIVDSKSGRAQTIQRALAVTNPVSTANQYGIQVVGKKADFCNTQGQNAGARGVIGVDTDYSSSYHITKADGTGTRYNSDVTVNTPDREYHRGHMLGAQNGGQGTPDNIFKQDLGQNSKGKWREFENDFNSKINSPTVGDNATITWSTVLNSTAGNIQPNQNMGI